MPFHLYAATALLPLCLLTLGSTQALAAQNAPTAEELLQQSDRARGSIGGGVSWDVRVENQEGTQTSAERYRYAVKAKGDNALAEALEPARSKGELMLFNDRNIVFFKPGLKKPVTISPRQKLMGQASYGDIASTNYYRDYTGKIVGEESVDGVPAWKLELKAKAQNVTYAGITYWIAKKDKLGIKADFYTPTGEKFKSATFSYGNTIKNDGKDDPFVSVMVITDSLRKDHQSTLTYEKPRRQDHPDSLFHINNLVR